MGIAKLFALYTNTERTKNSALSSETEQPRLNRSFREKIGMDFILIDLLWMTKWLKKVISGKINRKIS